jgi:hypothetical protein
VALAGKSTLNRLELHARAGVDRYHKIRPKSEAIEALFVQLFLDARARAPEQIVLDLDAADDPLHGHEEGRFFHGYYDGYCYLPLYIFCGEHLLCSKLRTSNIEGRPARARRLSASWRRSAAAGRRCALSCARTIRLRLLKIGAVVTVSVRRVKLAMSQACPHQREFIAAFHVLSAAAR